MRGGKREGKKPERRGIETEMGERGREEGLNRRLFRVPAGIPRTGEYAKMHYETL